MKKEVKVTNPVPETELLCNCGYGTHDHGECKSGSRCTNCGIVHYYRESRPAYVSAGDGFEVVFLCRYCKGELLTWDQSGPAAEMYPQGCRCENNGDYCEYCNTLLEEPDTTCPDCERDTGNGSTCAECAAALPESQEVRP